MDILSSIENFDPEKTGIITFLTFKQVLQNLNIRLSEKYTEYLIYIMKKNKFDSSSSNNNNIMELNLENLCYNNVVDLLDIESAEILNEITCSSDDNDNEEFNELLNDNDNEESLKNSMAGGFENIKMDGKNNNEENNNNRNISTLNEIDEINNDNNNNDNDNKKDHPIKIENEREGEKEENSCK